MTGAFAGFLSAIGQADPIGTIVQIGHGDVPAALETAAGAIIVALPAPLIPQALHGLAARDSRLKLWPAAIGAAAGRAGL